MNHRVRLITTGGTIATEEGADGPRMVGGEELLADLPPAERAGVDVEDLCALDSADLTTSHFEAIAERARRAVAEGCSGVVVTIGTDTLAEAAFAAELALADMDEPVVFTGAMRPRTHPAPDGPANLADALRVACHPAAVGRGVLAVLHGSVHAARWVTKVDARVLDAFRSLPHDRVGSVHGSHVELDRDHLPPRPPRAAGFEPSVALLKAVPGDDGGLLDHCVAAGYRGVVVEAYGLLHVPMGLRKAIGRARDAGVAVVVASRSWADVDRAGDLDGFIGAGDLSAPKARLALMAALATTDSAGVGRWFSGFAAPTAP